MGRTKQLFDEARQNESAENDFQNFIDEGNVSRKIQRDETNDLKSRVIEAKRNLPNVIIPTFLHVFPELNTYKGRSRLTNVLQLRIADEDITQKLERLIEILKNK